MPESQPPAGPANKPVRARGSRLSYHARRCSICRHPERELIDQEFLHWGHVGSIAATYQIDRRAIYRHAHATKLFRQRNRSLRFALGHIIEQAQAVEVTADSIVRAVRLFACLNDQGEWVAPPPRSLPVVTSQRPSPVRWALDELAGREPASPARSLSAGRPGGRLKNRGSASGVSAARSAHPSARSTHPANLKSSQLLEKTASRPV